MRYWTLRATVVALATAMLCATSQGASATDVVHEYTDHAGCVTLFTRHVEATETGSNWVELKAQMAGCSRGHLHLHTYVNYSEIFETHLLRNGAENECENSTACEVPWSERIYFVFEGTYTTYAHGWNTTTGGSTYVTHNINYP